MSKIYCRFFDTEADAFQHQFEVPDAFRPTQIIDGPEDNFAVVDLETAADILGEMEITNEQ